MNRKDFLRLSGIGLAAAAASGMAACRNDAALDEGSPRRRPTFEGEWGEIRGQFDLDPEYIHLAGLLIASHPRPVRNTLNEHQAELDRNPALYLQRNFTPRENEVRRTAANYMGAGASDVALTHSTTMGIALVYNGIDVGEGQEILTTDHDYYSTHEAIRYKTARTGASSRQIPLYEDSHTVTEGEIVGRISEAIRPETRVLALTWVHSSTGVKMPMRAIADAVADANRGRGATDRILICVDGVHGFGVEHDSMTDLGCDFFMAGTHKWIFAPRGTGVLWGNPQTHAAVTPTVPTFSRSDGWGPRMTPGGFHAFEHWWGVKEAFDFHTEIGKQRVTERIHALCRRFKEGVAEMSHVTLYTPMSDDLSAGIVCFDVAGMSPARVERSLRNRNIIMGETPYSPSYARVSPGLLNSEGEIDRTVEAIAALG